jgi:hypothetical protein
MAQSAPVKKYFFTGPLDKPVDKRGTRGEQAAAKRAERSTGAPALCI